MEIVQKKLSINWRQQVNVHQMIEEDTSGKKRNVFSSDVKMYYLHTYYVGFIDDFQVVSQ